MQPFTGGALWTSAGSSWLSRAGREIFQSPLRPVGELRSSRLSSTGWALPLLEALQPEQMPPCRVRARLGGTAKPGRGRHWVLGGASDPNHIPGEQNLPKELLQSILGSS